VIEVGLSGVLKPRRIAITNATGAANVQAYRSALPPNSTIAKKIEKEMLPPLNPKPRMEVGKIHSRNSCESGTIGSVSRIIFH
jgi:hypothetical protein